MEVLKFVLKGKTAFFKIPEVNTYCSFTYGNIHKVALMGIFGSILGYGGYAQMKKKDEYPEFYEKLQSLELSIVPKCGSKGYITKKVQSFNNSVGYASRETGGNLIVKQQWLEAPWWEIYLKIQDKESEKLKEAILQRRYVYLPYLGTNDHPADIQDAELLDGFPVADAELDRIDSFFPEDDLQMDYEEDSIIPFRYVEMLPVALECQTHMYQRKKIIYTNIPVLGHSKEVICVAGKNIVFF